MAGDDPGALLKSAPEDALQEWIVSSRVNRSGVGDDDAGLIERVAAAPIAPLEDGFTIIEKGGLALGRKQGRQRGRKKSDVGRSSNQ
nr:hypothetical protein [Methylocystis sp. H4A]